MSYNVLAIGAHPDDIEFGCFGALKKHKDQGDNVTLLVMTQSDVKDAHTGKITRDSSISKKEANTAANILDVELILGPFQDTKVPFDSESVKFIENIIKEKEINWVYTHWAGDTHQDHINTLNATLAASRMVDNVLCYEQVPLPRVCMSYPIANYYVDISSTLNDKLKSCAYHKSQLKKYSDMEIDILDNVKTLARYRGNQSNIKYAEAFNVLKIVDK